MVLATREMRQCVLLDIILIGEALTSVSGEVKSLRPDIPWRAVTRTRNRFVHRYWASDATFIRGLISKDLPPLMQALRGLIMVLERDDL